MEKNNNKREREEIYSQRVRAGKRTYFFDVRATRSNDYYLTVTESKKKSGHNGYYYEKHKLFLYKEDFNKFFNALQETIDHIKTELMPDVDFSEFDNRNDEEVTEEEEVQETETESGSDLKWD